MKNLLSPKLLKSLTLVLLLTFAFSSFSCKSYYKVDKENTIDSNRLTDLESNGKYLIIHGANATYKINNFKIIDDKITGVAEELPDVHKAYIHTDVYGKNKYKPNNKVILNEVHIYTSQKITTKEDLNILLSTITKIEIYNKDKNATTKSWVFGSIGVGLGIYVILGILTVLAIFTFMVSAG